MLLNIQTPDWVKDAIFYQIFPDRFARSPRTKQRAGLQFKPWGSPPEEQGYQGGDLYGVVDKLDYLQELGINALYLNPIFSSASNHRYHTYDYFAVDPLLGGDDALRELLDQAHARDMRVVLDGVFNHTGRGFWPFHHILENGGNSPYIDWFNVQEWPLRPYNHDAQNPHNYDAWWNLPALPKLNTDNPGVRQYIMEVARYWIDFGIDGWRLDVPGEIDDDAFWQEFRRVVKGANPDAYILGEIWTEAQRWCQGDQFDAVMNYLFTVPTLNFFGAKTLRLNYDRQNYDLRPFIAPQLNEAIHQMFDLYDWQINLVQLNLLDSHDTARALWILGEDKAALRLAVLFQMTMPGTPCIYYGDEIGLSAGDDPYCREAFPWHQENDWDNDLLTFYQKATTLRHENPVLRRGRFQTLLAQGNIFAFRRFLDGNEAIVIFNNYDTPFPIKLSLPEDAANSYQQKWPEPGITQQVENFELSLLIPSMEAVVLVKHDS